MGVDIQSTRISSSSTAVAGNDHMTIMVVGLLLHPGSAASTVTLKAGGSSGTEILYAVAPANSETVVVHFNGMLPVMQVNALGQKTAKNTELYCTLSGTGASATILYALA